MSISPRVLGLLACLAAAGWSPFAGAAVVKAVQTGSVAMSALTQSVTITSVDTTKSFVLCQFVAANGSQDSDRITCELNSATTLTVKIGVIDAAVVVRWYVVEFLSGVSVQRGVVPTTTFTSGTATVDVTLPSAVSLTKSFPLITTLTTSTSRSIDEEFTPTAELTTTTNLRLNRNRTGTAFSVAWQVVQIQAASVQRGTLNMPQGNTTATATLNPAVDTSRTFVVFTSNGGSSINGVESRYQTTGVITNSTTLTFTRAANGGGGNDLDIAWFAIRMTDGTTVQRGTNTTPSIATDTMNSTISAIVLNRSVPILSVRGDPGRSSNNDLDDTCWVGTLTSTTNIQVARSSTASSAALATVAWEVIQFANAPNIIDGDGQEFFP